MNSSASVRRTPYVLSLLAISSAENNHLPLTCSKAAARSKQMPSTANSLGVAPGFALAAFSTGGAGAGAAVYGTVCFHSSGDCPMILSQ